MENIFTELHQRGLIVECSQKGDVTTHLNTPRILYCGFDPTADSLHVGSLMPLITLLRFIHGGHTAIVLIGGGTGLIGDPSFKTSERDLQDVKILAKRCSQIQAQCELIYSHFTALQQPKPSKKQLKVLNNKDWLGGHTLIDFLRDIGKHFSVNAMIKKESVAGRLAREDQGISFTEFSYMLLQAYDFAQLYQKESCTLQIGGSDQWGNIVAGISLIRRTDDTAEPAYGMTLPLITRADGGKFGKTEMGTVWLSGEHTSAYAFHQFWLNVDDADLYRYLRYFSFRPLAELAKLEEQGGQDTQQLLSHKEMLADEMTALVHGADSLKDIAHIRSSLFSDNSNELSAAEFKQLAQGGLETTQLQKAEYSLAECLVECGLARTPKGEVTIGQARKLIQAGAVSVNGVAIKDENAVLSRKQALHDNYYLLKRGKKTFCLLSWA